MKKAVFVLIFFITTHIVTAQKFVVTQAGIRSDVNPEESAIVLEIDSLSASTLYKNAHAFIQERFKNPDKVIKAETENEYLRYEVYIPAFIQWHETKKRQYPMYANYTIELKFKDGRMRYEVSNLV